MRLPEWQKEKTKDSAKKDSEQGALSQNETFLDFERMELLRASRKVTGSLQCETMGGKTPEQNRLPIWQGV